MSDGVTIPLIPGRGTAVIELDSGERVRVTGWLEGTARFEEHIDSVSIGGIHRPGLREQVVTLSVKLRLGRDDQLAYERRPAEEASA